RMIALQHASEPRHVRTPPRCVLCVIDIPPAKVGHCCKPVHQEQTPRRSPCQEILMIIWTQAEMIHHEELLTTAGRWCLLTVHGEQADEGAPCEGLSSQSQRSWAAPTLVPAPPD